MTEELVKIAEKADRLARVARVQDLSLMLAQSDLERIARIGNVLEKLNPGDYLVGTGPYTQGVYSVMSDEVVLGRLATPVEEPLDKPVDIFCADGVSLSPREVSRYHALIARLGDVSPKYAITDLGSTCGTYVNGKRVPGEGVDLHHGDVVSLGPSMINTYMFIHVPVTN